MNTQVLEIVTRVGKKNSEEFIGISATPKEDGLYKIYSIVINTDVNDKNTYDVWYNYTGPLQQVTYQTKNDGGWSNPINVDIEALFSINITDSNIVNRVFEYTISYKNLKECYYNLASDFLDKNNGGCSSQVDSSDRFNLDLIWITLSVIHYLIECGKYIEAGEILNKFHTCNSICDNMRPSRCGCGCGCGKH